MPSGEEAAILADEIFEKNVEQGAAKPGVALTTIQVDPAKIQAMQAGYEERIARQVGIISRLEAWLTESRELVSSLTDAMTTLRTEVASGRKLVATQIEAMAAKDAELEELKTRLRRYEEEPTAPFVEVAQWETHPAPQLLREGEGGSEVIDFTQPNGQPWLEMRPVDAPSRVL